MGHPLDRPLRRRLPTLLSRVPQDIRHIRKHRPNTPKRRHGPDQKMAQSAPFPRRPRPTSPRLPPAYPRLPPRKRRRALHRRLRRQPARRKAPPAPIRDQGVERHFRFRVGPLVCGRGPAYGCGGEARSRGEREAEGEEWGWEGESVSDVSAAHFRPPPSYGRGE